MLDHSDNPAHLAWAPQGDGILADSRLLTEALLKLLPEGRREAPVARAAPPTLDPRVFDARLAFERIAAVLPNGAIVVEEAPSHRAAMQERLRLSRPDSFFTTASGGLGYAMPAAAGVALARPDRRVVAIVGDGSAMYSIQAIFTACQFALPITFIVLNNRRYEALRGFGRIFGMQQVPGTDLTGLDFVSLARGQGVTDGCRVQSTDELDRALAQAFARSTPTLIEVVID